MTPRQQQQHQQQQQLEQHWQSNQDLGSLNLTLSAGLNSPSNGLPTCDAYSPSIVLTPARNPTSNFLYSYGLDDINNASSRNILDDGSMVLDSNALSSTHSLMNNSTAPNQFDRLFEAPPWTAQGITSHPTSNTSDPGTARFHTNRSIISRPSRPVFAGHRAPPTSNPEECTPAANPFSSFYNHHNLRATRSVVSGTDYCEGLPDDTSGYGDITDATTGMNLSTHHTDSINQSTTSLPHIHTNLDLLSPCSQDFPSSGLSTQPKRPLDIPKKSHFCDVAGCENQKGFGSSSDLDRHKKAIHNIIPQNGRDRNWQCAAPNCKSSKKVWGRLDNFKNHCKNCHKTLDTMELVKKSVVTIEESQQSQLETPTESNFKMDMNFSDMSEADSKSILANDNAPETISGAELAHLSRPPFNESPSSNPRRSSIVESTPTSATGYFGDFSSSSPFLRPSTEDNRMEQQPSSRLHQISTGMLNSFSSNLLEDISTSLNLAESLKMNVQALISAQINILVQATTFYPDGSETKSFSGTASVGSARQKGKYRCKHQGCGKPFDRPCELNKHAKRHDRPYYCTWPDCTSKRAFGSKADWKRHENTLHFRHLSYHCQETRRMPEEQHCDKIFHRADPYVAHLKRDHGIRDDREIQQRLEEKEISPPPSTFWCGFCNEMQPISTELEEPWNSRFDHIERHFKERRSMDDWKPEPNIHADDAQPSNNTMTIKRGSDPDLESLLLGTNSDEALFDPSIYEAQEEEEEFQHPRPKRARAHEPDRQEDWATSMTGNRNNENDQNDQNDQWLSNIMAS